MVVFGIESDKHSPALEEFMEDTNQRLKGNELSINPFIDSKVIRDGPKRYILIMKPIYPKLHYYVVIIMIILYLIFQRINVWLYISGFIVLVSWFVHSKYFYYLTLRLGLMKEKIKISVRLL